MQILILGAGAVGLSLAAKLSAVCDVHAVCRKKHADRIQEQGFKMTGLWGEGTYRFSSSETVPEGMDFDYVFITTKSLATEKTCEQFADLIRGKEVISLQNGIGNEEIISRYTNKVIGGTIITGFEWRGDARVHVSVEGGPMTLGRFPAGLDKKVETLVELIKQAGIPVQATENIQGALWAKTIYNCALNPLGAVMGVPYGELADPHAWNIIKEIVEEAFAVTESSGVKLPWATAKEYLDFLHETQLPNTAAHHSSMLQDLTAGRKTEIDFLNGAVVSRAEKLGIKAPFNAFISEQIRFMEDLIEKKK